MESSQTNGVFLKQKPSMALVTIRKAPDAIYSRKISKQIDCTYAHTVKLISSMNDMGLIESKKEGRKKVLDLTSKGERYADALIDMMGEEESIR